MIQIPEWYSFKDWGEGEAMLMSPLKQAHLKMQVIFYQRKTAGLQSFQSTYSQQYTVLK